MRPWFLLLLIAACNPNRGGGGDDDDSTAGDDDTGDDDTSDDDAGDDDTTPTSESDCADGVDEDADGAADCQDSDCQGDPACVETNCEDGVDEDFDGQLDCADSDCDTWVPCSWPVQLTHQGSLSYDANFVAKLGGAQDCSASFTAPLAPPATFPCATCDRSFGGVPTFQDTSCLEDLGSTAPTQLSYGIDFDGPAGCWVVYAPDEAGVYGDPAGNACDGDGDGTWVLSRTDQVDYQGTDVGDLTTTLSFTVIQ